MNQVLELTAFRASPAWEILAAHYLLLIQAGACAMLVACAGRAFNLQSLAGLRRWGVIGAAGLILCAPLNLVAELLSPARFASLFYRVHLSSPLSWGGFAILILSGFALAECLLLIKDARGANRTIPRLSSLAALGVLAYTAVEVNNASGIPLWSGLLPTCALLGSGLAAGLAVCLGLSRLSSGVWKESPPCRAASFASAFSALSLLSWAALAPLPEFPGWALAKPLLFGGSLAFMLAAWLFLGDPGKRLILACSLVLSGAWAARALILSAGQAAALGREIGEPHLIGHAGLLSALAPFGLWIFLMLAASLLLERISWLEPGQGGDS